MAEIDVNRIANIVADIQTGQEAVDKLVQDIKIAEEELESDKCQLDDERENVKALRRELEDYLDELIPEEDTRSQRKESWEF